MERLNDLPDNKEVREPINSLQLFYAATGGQDNQVSKVADSSFFKEQQCVFNEDPALNRTTNSNEHMFNMQLPYNVNQALDAESWNGNFHAISLHGLMEHLMSDIKHIKESLYYIQKYILNKSIEGNKANNIMNLEEVSEAAWGFISALYESYWDYLITNKNNFSFKHKVKAQFNPQINRDVTPKKDKEVNKLASVSALPPLIPAKSPKEVVKILKIFKKNPDNKENKSYAQSIIH